MVELITKIQGNTLNLYDYEITAQDIGSIMEFIGINPHITELNLTMNSVVIVGCLGGQYIFG